MLCWRSRALRTDGCLTCMPTLGATLGCGPDPGAEHLGQGRARRARAARQPGARARGAPGAAAAAQPAGGRGAIAAQRRRLCPTCGAGLSCAGLLCASEACVCAFCLVALGQHCGNRSAYTSARLGRTHHGRAQQLNPTVCENAGPWNRARQSSRRQSTEAPHRMFADTVQGAAGVLHGLCSAGPQSKSSAHERQSSSRILLSAPKPNTRLHLTELVTTHAGEAGHGGIACRATSVRPAHVNTAIEQESITGAPTTRAMASYGAVPAAKIQGLRLRHAMAHMFAVC